MQYTAIAFTAGARTSKRSDTLGMIALGTEKGSITLWNLQTGSVSHTLKGHTLTVTSLVFNSQGTLLFSASADNQIIQWSTESGKLLKIFKGSKRGLQRICLSPDNTRLLAASHSVKLWDLTSEKVVAKFGAAHSTAVSILAFSHDQRYFISGTGDRAVSLWEISVQEEDTGSKKGSKKRKKSLKGAPNFTFNLDGTPVYLSFNPQLQGESGLYEILAVSDRGVVSIWAWNSEEGTVQALKPNCSIQLQKDSKLGKGSRKSIGPKSGISVTTDKNARSGLGDVEGEGGVQSIINAIFYSQNEVMVVQSNPGALKPVFHIVKYKEDKSYIKSIVLNPTENSIFQSQSNHVGEEKKKRKRSSTAVTSNSDEEIESDKKQSQPTNHVFGSVDALSPSAESLIPPSSSFPFPVTQSDEENDEGDDADEEKGVAQRKRKKTRIKNIEGAAKALAQRVIEQEQSKKKPVPRGVPRAGTLQTVLAQALHTNDESLLDYCIQMGKNERLIRHTVQRLPLQYVMPLLTCVIRKFTTQPGRALSLIGWINQVLRVHTAYLLQQPLTSGPLSTLFNSIDGRVAVFKKLLKLSGRLDLILAQTAPSTSLEGPEVDL